MKGLMKMQVIITMLFMLIYLGVVIYIISLAGRLVHAVERIADKFEDFQPPMESWGFTSKVTAFARRTCGIYQQAALQSAISGCDVS